MPSYNTSGERDADRYLRLKENMEEDLPISNHFRKAYADPHALAEITIGYQVDPKAPTPPLPAPVTCIVSATEEPILYNKNKMQISVKSPIGKFVFENLHNLAVGMKLPNNAVILDIAYVNLAT